MRCASPSSWCFAAAICKLLAFAGGVADDVRLEVEHHLMQAEIDRQIEILVGDRSDLPLGQGGHLARRRIDGDFVNDESPIGCGRHFAIESSVRGQAPTTPPLLTVFQDEV